MAKALPGQTLPSREQGQFRSIVKFYETKQYKKGVKTADGILKKFPEHGGTERFGSFAPAATNPSIHPQRLLP